VAGDNIRLDYVRQSVGLTRGVSEIVLGPAGAIDGEDVNFSPAVTRAMTSDRWASTRQLQRLLNPQLILIDVIANPGLVIESSATQFVVQDDVNPITFTVDPVSGLITGLSTRELDYYRRDVPIEVTYGDWQEFEGVLFPMEVTLTLDGAIYHRETRSFVEVNPIVPAGFFDLPAGVVPVTDPVLADRGKRTSQYLQSFAALGFIKDGAHAEVNFTEIRPGVFHLTDPSNNSLVIEQANGIVVVETVLHDLRAQAIRDRIAAQFPAKPITHIINTHFHSDHAAGLRPFVAGGATLVVHEAAQAFYADRLLRTNTTILPDALDLNPTAAVIQTVPILGSFRIEDIDRPVAVHPAPTTHVADMVIVSVENAGVIFVSDIFSPGGAAGPGAVEFNNAVIAAGIDTNNALIAGGHGGTIAYADFVGLLP
jgi:glyoxylase-like metal-dependent hydrolase (beta-lactamase superfamily II)